MRWHSVLLCLVLSCAASKVEQIGKLKLFISALQDPERRCVDTATANHSGTCVYVCIWYIHIYVHTVRMYMWMHTVLTLLCAHMLLYIQACVYVIIRNAHNRLHTNVCIYVHAVHTQHTHTHTHTYTHNTRTQRERERERERERGGAVCRTFYHAWLLCHCEPLLAFSPPSPPSPPLPRLPMNMLDKWREALIKAPLPRQPVSHYPHPSHLFAADSAHMHPLPAHMHPLPAHIYCLCESLDQTCILPLAVSQCVFLSPCPMLMFRSIVTQ